MGLPQVLSPAPVEPHRCLIYIYEHGHKHGSKINQLYKNKGGIIDSIIEKGGRGQITILLIFFNHSKRGLF